MPERSGPPTEPTIFLVDDDDAVRDALATLIGTATRPSRWRTPAQAPCASCRSSTRCRTAPTSDATRGAFPHCLPECPERTTHRSNASGGARQATGTAHRLGPPGGWAGSRRPGGGMMLWRLVYERALAATGHPLITRGAQGRWNSAGVRVTSTSESVALAAIELLAYWNTYPHLAGYRLFRLEVPEDQISQADPAVDVQDHQQTRPSSDRWAGEVRSLALRVPSVVLPHSTNVLLNQRHPGFTALSAQDLGAFQYDPRVMGLVEQAKRR